MDELEIISRFFAQGFPARSDVLLGVGDDGGLTRPGPEEELVSVCDTLVAGTHFPPDFAPEAIAHRALAANLSDLAAMGAVPRWFLLSLALPNPESDWLTRFAAGLAALAAAHDVALIGGDTVRGHLAVTITALGVVPAGQALRRDGAAPGDGVFVTGTCGDAGWVWRSLVAGDAVSAEDPLYRRFAFPQPRVHEAITLRALASAMIDISDGLHVDLGRLLAASGVGAAVHADALPLSAALVEKVGDVSARTLALTGGEDYELCFTLPPERADALSRRSEAWNCGVERIGEVTGATGLRWFADGVELAVPDQGFVHF